MPLQVFGSNASAQRLKEKFQGQRWDQVKMTELFASDPKRFEVGPSPYVTPSQPLPSLFRSSTAPWTPHRGQSWWTTRRTR